MLIIVAVLMPSMFLPSLNMFSRTHMQHTNFQMRLYIPVY
jgi:hypothetical protein